jgi:hypothetical protein
MKVKGVLSDGANRTCKIVLREDACRTHRKGERASCCLLHHSSKLLNELICMLLCVPFTAETADKTVSGSCLLPFTNLNISFPKLLKCTSIYTE